MPDKPCLMSFSPRTGSVHYENWAHTAAIAFRNLLCKSGEDVEVDWEVELVLVAPVDLVDLLTRLLEVLPCLLVALGLEGGLVLLRVPQVLSVELNEVVREAKLLVRCQQRDWGRSKELVTALLLL